MDDVVDPAGASAQKIRWTAAASDEGVRLDKFLAAGARLGSRSRAVDAIDRGRVFLNDVETRPGDGAHRLSAGDRVRLWMDRPGSAARPRRPPPDILRPGAPRIVYEDAAIIVVDKPAGLLAVESERGGDAPSVISHLEEHLARTRARPFVVHRIDRDTSGLVVVATRADSRRHLMAQFRRRLPERVYWAVVEGHPDPGDGVWRDEVVWDARSASLRLARGAETGGATAVSRCRVLERFRACALVELRLETGKRHQIRLQASVRGHPLVGDARYTAGIEPRRRVEFGRQALHARHLRLRHPDDDRLLAFDAPLPADLEALLARLRRE